MPSGQALHDYHGICWTGSSLTIHDEADDRVTRQIEFAKAGYEAAVPMFGSCWAAQMAVTAAGGKCAKNPKGREFGLARKIALNSAGQDHPMFRGKKPVFDGFTSHEDEVAELPEGAVLLASNDFSRVQAVEVASLCRWRREALTEQGNFASLDDADQFIGKMQALHENPASSHLRWQLGVDGDVLNDAVRQQEVRNWIEVKILPRLNG